jgi:ATP-dependent protease ClpP protease subunit
MRARIGNLRPAATSWYKVYNTTTGAPTRVDVYDDIGMGGWFADGLTSKDFAAQISDIPGDLEVHINSGGGDVFEGIAIYNAIASRPGNVTTVVDGIAASIASVIAQAGKTRVIAPGAMMMIHDGLAMCMGNAADMREMAGLLDQVSDNLAGIYAAHSGTAAGWRDAMRTETWYSAEQAVTAGLADKLADRPASPDAILDHDLTMFALTCPNPTTAHRRATSSTRLSSAPHSAPRSQPRKGRPRDRARNSHERRRA